VDPLDGTANFAAGRAPFAVMVALQHRGETVAGWILDPLSGRLACAQRGAGAWLDGTAITAAADVPGLARMRGSASARYLPQSLRAHARAARPAFGALSGGSGCAGADYQAVVTAERDFAMYWRTLPWDHAPGVLLITEAGGVARRLDRSAYRADDYARPGLLVARNAGIWELAAGALAPERLLRLAES